MSHQNSVFSEVENLLEEKNFTVDKVDKSRPWGGFFVIEEDQAERFIKEFFPHVPLESFSIFSKLSPKMLIVEPEKRLSWQYHNRRSEVWRVVKGNVGIVMSETDEQTPVTKVSEGEYISLDKGIRHRLVGLNEWGVVAEIWQHTDPEDPSDEQDIVRLQDDYGR